MNKKQLEDLDKTIIKIIGECPDPSILSSELFERVIETSEFYENVRVVDIYKRFKVLVEMGLIGRYGVWQYEEPSYYKIHGENTK